jgi:hypothetical protein
MSSVSDGYFRSLYRISCVVSLFLGVDREGRAMSSILVFPRKITRGKGSGIDHCTWLPVGWVGRGGRWHLPWLPFTAPSRRSLTSEARNGGVRCSFLISYSAECGHYCDDDNSSEQKQWLSFMNAIYQEWMCTYITISTKQIVNQQTLLQQLKWNKCPSN